MASVSESELRPAARPLRTLLFVAASLVLIAGFQLFVLSEATDRYFAWTIRPPLTAAVLGAAYWATLAIVIPAARQPFWALARIAIPTVATFTTLTLVVTLLHLDRFHFGSPEPITLVATWAWLLVYAIVPLLLLGAVILQLRVRGSDPPRVAPLQDWFRLILGIQGAILLIVGLALLIAPERVAPWWPWPITALTGRAIGAWATAIAVAAAHTIWENDLLRAAAAIPSYAALGVLELLAVARYAATLDWQRPGPWLAVAFSASMLVVGGYALWRSRRIGARFV